jgi:ClpP class serine protease
MGKKDAIRGAKLLSWGLSVPWMASAPALKAAADMCLEMIRLNAENSPIDLSDFLALQAVAQGKIEVLDPDLDFLPQDVQADTGSTPEWGKRDGVQIVNRTAIIPIQGMIYRYADMFTMMCGGTTTQSLSKAIRSAQNDRSVDSIVLEIDSPGGEADGIAELARQIRATNAIKPVVAHGDGDVASAAYYLAAAAGRIVVSPSSLIGCIGTLGMIPNPDLETPPKAAIPLVSKQSPKKYIDTRTPEGRAQLQTWIDDLGQVFVDDVAEFRGTTPKNVEENYGQGDCLIAAKALKIGMVDAIGGLDDVLMELAEARNEDRPVSMENGGRRMGILDRIKAAMDGTPDPQLEALLEGSLTTPQVPTPGMAVHNPIALTLAEAQPVNIQQQRTPEPAQPVTAVSVEDSQEYKALQARIAEYEAKEREAKIEQRGRDAETWAKGVVLAGQALPAEQAILVQLYEVLAQDDEDRGPISDTLTRIGLLQSLTDTRPTRDHTAETVPVIEEGTQLRIVENLTESLPPDQEGEVDEEERTRLLSMTSAGRMALEKRRQAAR